ncbi:MAG: DUF1329 domain-containing protein [Desulfatiglandales bacterium]|nr:DUF1329 domain-containing protein [Desulfatiglandales bacterium]
MKKCRTTVFMTFVMLLVIAVPVTAEESPHWVKQWRDWAQQTKNSEYIEWSEKISTPTAIQLGKEWEEYLGYNAVDMVAKDQRAPSIKPGLVITRDNVAQYEKELRELMPFGFDYEVDRVMGTEGTYNAPLEMVILPTHHTYNDRGYLTATKKYSKNCKIGEKTNLEGWVAGLPFPFPKTGLEIVHNYDRLTIMADNLNSMPAEFGLHGSKGERERVEKVELHWRNYAGRIKIDPFPVIPGMEDVYEKGSIVALYPYDLRGFGAVRTRYKDPNIEDSFVTYIPSMRRIRRLAGSNTQDPLVGSDFTWEDWKGYWSKISLHKANYEILGEDIMLCPSFHPNPPPVENKYGGLNQRYNFERRPVWIIKIDYDEPTYIYKSRVWVVDKETFYPRMMRYYDAKGRFWKFLDLSWRWNPDNGEQDYWGATNIDTINKHSTALIHTITLNMENISENLFNLRYLSSKAH